MRRRVKSRKSQPLRPVRVTATGESSTSVGRYLVIALIAAAALGGGGFFAMRSSGAADESEVATATEIAPPTEEETARASAAIEEARQHIRDAIETSICPSEDEWDTARALYEEALQLNPSEPAAAAGVALTLGGLQLARTDDAAPDQWMGDALIAGLVEETYAHYVLGLHELNRNPIEAWGYFSVLLDKEKDWLPAKLGMAWADIASEEGEKARDTFRAAAQRWPGRHDIAYGYALALESAGDQAGSNLWLGKAFELGSREPTTIRAHTDRRLAAGEGPAVLDEMEAELRNAPDDTLIALECARIATELEDPARAIDILSGLSERDPKNIDILLALTSAHISLDNFDTARTLLGTVEILDPQNSLVYYYIGHVERSRGDTQLALENFKSGCAKGMEASCYEACILKDVSSCERLPRERAIKAVTDVYAQFYTESWQRQEGRNSGGARRYYYRPRSTYQQKGKVYTVRDRQRSTSSRPRLNTRTQLPRYSSR